MRCEKCSLGFKEEKLDLSHDIPRWLGGEDKDGRTYLCRKCHKEYEGEILKQVLMNFIKELPYHKKKKYQWYARLVRRYYLKKEVEDDSI